MSKLSMWRMISARSPDGRAGIDQRVHERDVSSDTAEQWLARYRADSPGTVFMVAEKRPNRRSFGMGKKS